LTKDTLPATEVSLKRFAWMGISFLIPETWALGRYQGTFNEGTLRIDDLVQERITLMWKRVRDPDLDLFVERHLKETEKQSKKHKLPFEYQRGLRALPGGGELFWWKSDLEAYSFCFREGKKDARLVFFRLLARPDENLRTAAEAIAESVELDKGQKDLRWTVYGLDIRLPREMIPADFSFKTGCVRLSFERPGERLDVEKFGPADVIMQGMSLFDWLQSVKRKVLLPYDFTGETEKIQGHSGGHFRGKSKKRWTRGFKRFDYWGWECDRENRLFCILHQYKDRDKTEFKFDLSKIWCHLPVGAEATKRVELPPLEFREPLPQFLNRGRQCKKTVSRGQMLTSVPVRNEAVNWEEKNGQVEIVCDLRLRWGGKFFQRMAGVEQGKRFSLDEMGGYVWQCVDGTKNVRELVDMLAQKYKLEQVEAHAALLAFLRNMMKKRLIGLYVPESHGGR